MTGLVIVLDTNVVSEVMKLAPNGEVMDWINSKPASEFYVTAVTQAELLYGIEIMPRGRRRDGLLEAVRLALELYFPARVLPFDGLAAEAFAGLAAARRKAGRPVSQFDGQIAAIALSRQATLATRNLDDFADCGIALVNPWVA